LDDGEWEVAAARSMLMSTTPDDPFDSVRTLLENMESATKPEVAVRCMDVWTCVLH
jgi:hypothetical protein